MFATHSQTGLIRKRFGSKTLILAVCLCLWGSLALAAENPQTDPQAVVKSGTDQVLRILQQYPQDTRARREQIRSVVDGYFDFEALARLAVGSKWNSVPPEKRQEFTKEFSRLLFYTYVGDIEKYARERVAYHQRQLGPGYVVVDTARNGPKRPDHHQLLPPPQGRELEGIRCLCRRNEPGAQLSQPVRRDIGEWLIRSVVDSVKAENCSDVRI